MSEGKKAGAPAWMVSFGDMMTLILTFFILLVSLSKERQHGLIAAGIGSFMVNARSMGLPGLLNESEKSEIFDNVRRRFNLPPESDPDRRTDHVDAAHLELIRAKAVSAIRPHDEITQPGIATFEPDSAEVTDAAKRYLDLMVGTLRPTGTQVLLLEGHAYDAGPRFDHDDRWLAFERARSVRDYLVEEHGFKPNRIQTRAWFSEVEQPGPATRRVDARLVLPADD